MQKNVWKKVPVFLKIELLKNKQTKTEKPKSSSDSINSFFCQWLNTSSKYNHSKKKKKTFLHEILMYLKAYTEKLMSLIKFDQALIWA